ncbi:hypothetical protein [Paenibacillus periandrae]|uniref:hypothetical protein n=1 Tax=Paenibacillus periandrae TaxID=1761741 RepID=UPI001F09B9CB|nr:hypothetical protein [Paenibacillus periandrae]
MSRRDEIVNSLRQQNSLSDGMEYSYVLTHTYDLKPRFFYLSAPYPIATMNALIAFIQFECFEIDETYGMDQTDILTVLTQIYECVQTTLVLPHATEIDLNHNWEYWCSSQVQSIPLFQKEQLRELLQQIVGEQNEPISE